MKKSKNKYNISNRIVFILAAFLLVALIFTIRLLELQVFGGKQYKQGAIDQRRAVVEIAAERGNIYDIDKNVLAKTVTVNTCYLFPKTFKQRENLEKDIENISRALGLERQTIYEKMESKTEPVVLKSKLSQEEVDLIKKLNLGFSISIEQENGRFYPEGQVLSQVIGFTNDSNEGLYGVEKYYDKDLSGKSGIKVYTRSSNGNVIPYESYEEYKSQAGKNLVLTVNSKIQNIVNKVLKKSMDKFELDSASIIVMEPNTGKILAMESAPTFDKNNPRIPIDQAIYNKYSSQNEKNKLNILYSLWSNPAVSKIYEPGSVLKALTTSIALEEKTSKEGDIYHCDGTFEVIKGVRINCWRRYDPHGDQTLEEAFGNSCNPAFVQIVRQIGKDTYYDYIKSYKIGSITGVDLPAEEKGQINDYSKIGPVELATMSYGHGVAITPLQVISSVNATINGGYYFKPYILDHQEDEEGNIVKENKPELLSQVISKESSDIMREYMKYNVDKGASNAAKIEGKEIGAKSGTTLKAQDGSYNNDAVISSYYAFYPVSAPKYSILVVADNPKKIKSGNAVAGEMTKNILQGLINIEEELKLEDKNK